MRSSKAVVMFLMLSLIVVPVAAQTGGQAPAKAPAKAPGKAAVKEPSFDITEVAPGVYAAVGRGNVASNGAFIVNQDDVLVVDTHYRPSWARDLIAEIRKVTKKPVRYVVNSHWHNDHVQGNQAYVNVFGPGVEYLAQHQTREDMASKAIPSVQDALNTSVPNRIANTEKMLKEGKNQRGEDLTPEARKQLETRLADDRVYLKELKQIQITLPTITFERSLILHKPDRDIHIYFFGKGHTRGDVVVYLPKEKVVVTGDLLTNGIPFMRDAYPSLWVGTLESIAALDWQQAIPGHGGVQPDKGQITKLIAYMKDMVAGVKDAIGKGMTLEEARSKIDLSKHSSNFPNFQGGNRSAIDRCWAELTGQLKD